MIRSIPLFIAITGLVLSVGGAIELPRDAEAQTLAVWSGVCFFALAVMIGSGWFGDQS